MSAIAEQKIAQEPVMRRRDKSDHRLMFPPDADMRRHDRVPLSLFGHYQLANGAEIPCATRDVSEGGVAVSAAERGAPGEKVTLRLDHLGALEGEIVRSFDGGFAIALTVTPERQAELAAYIQWLYARTAVSLIEAPLTGDGAIDESVLGASFKIDAAMTRGADHLSGETAARLRRNASGQTEMEFFVGSKASGF